MTPERLEKIKKVISRRSDFLVPVLDNVYDPHNFAAVLRTCEAFGLQEVHVITTCEKFQLERKISKGCERWLTIPIWHDYASCFKHLKDQGRLLAATALLPASGKPCLPIPDLPTDRPLALIFGNEHRGVSRETIEACDLTAYLPMEGFVESLNISAAVAASLGAFLPRLRRENPSAALSPEKQKALLEAWLLEEPKRTGKQQ